MATFKVPPHHPYWLPLGKPYSAAAVSSGVLSPSVEGAAQVPNTESERGFGGANADDNGSKVAIPNEGEQGPNSVDDEGRCRSTRQVDPIDRLVPGANNIRGYSETVCKFDTNGRFEQFNLWTF